MDFDQYYIIDEGVITGRSGNCLDVVNTLQNDSLYRMFKLSKTFAQNCFMVLILNFDCRLLVYLHVKTLFISATAIRSLLLIRSSRSIYLFLLCLFSYICCVLLLF